MDKSELIEILNQRDMALAAANARVVELEMASIEQPPYKQDLIDRMKRMEDALKELLRLYVRPDGTIATLTYQKHHYPALEWEKAKDALEEKP